MPYSPKHAAPRPVSKARKRALGVVAAGGATVAATLGSVNSAQAATPSDVWDRLAACESGGNWRIATGNGFYGGLQFNAGSWRAAGGTRYASMPHRASREEQIAVAKRLLRMQGPTSWPVCSKRAGLTRLNGLSSGGAAASRSNSRAVIKPKTVNQPVLTFSRKSVRDMQSWLGMHRTGRWSPALISKLQKRVGAAQDGELGPGTVYKTERFLGLSPSGLSYLNQKALNALKAYSFEHRGL